MKNVFGNNVSITIFGESHGKAIGATLDGLGAGIKIDEEFIKSQLALRRGQRNISTGRNERDEYQIISGVHNGFTTGTPITVIIPNNDVKSSDYNSLDTVARPSHVDYCANVKYKGYQDKRGGGHFSGRITAGLVAVGAICISALKQKGIDIGTHIKRCACIDDDNFGTNLKKEIDILNGLDFAVLNEAKGKLMQEAILNAKENGDSVGGVLETVILGMPTGIGEPFFDSVESVLSHALFSIPSVKGIEFGLGFGIADLTGSKANDSFAIENEKVVTLSNNNGGINGGISNGMPIIFRLAIKPTPTIFKEQKTIDFAKNEEVVFLPKGRHDPAIIHRARVVVDSMTAIALCDLLACVYGTEYFGE